MPNKKKNKGKSNRKGRGRVTRKTSRGNVLSKGTGATTRVPASNFQADAQRVTLKFVDVVHLSASSPLGQLVTQNYGLNTPRVPERTGSTGQSQGWASLSAMYNQYVCLGSRIDWQITQTVAAAAPAAAGMAIGAVYPNPNTSGSASVVADDIVQKYARSHEFNTYTSSSPFADSPYARWRGRHSMTVAKLTGEPNLRQDSFEAAVSTDPAFVCLWTFQFQDVLADTNYKPSFVLRVQLEYDCIFFDRKLIVNTVLLRTVSAQEAKGFGGTEFKEPPSPPETVDRYTLVDLTSPDAKARAPTALKPSLSLLTPVRLSVR